MLVVDREIGLEMLKEMSKKMFNHLVKAVVDIQNEIMVVDAELHADQEDFLLENGSDQQDLWGINMHPEKFGTEDFVEFDSMINIRPSWGNHSRSVESLEIQKKILHIVNKLVTS